MALFQINIPNGNMSDKLSNDIMSDKLYNDIMSDKLFQRYYVR